MKHGILFILLFTLVSCKTTKVEREVPIVLQNVHNDSTRGVAHTEVYKYIQQNCTITVDTTGNILNRVTDRVTTIKNISHDTLLIYRADTINQPVYLTETKIEDKIPEWCKYLIAVLISVTSLLGFVLFLRNRIL